MRNEDILMILDVVAQIPYKYLNITQFSIIFLKGIYLLLWACSLMFLLSYFKNFFLYL